MRAQIRPEQTRRIILWLAFSLCALFLTACSSQANASVARTPTAYIDSMSPSFSGSINANGLLQPAQQVTLSFAEGDFVESILVEVGDSVQAGETLARLDSTETQLVVRRAEAELVTAQANYDLVATGISAEQQQAAFAAASIELISAKQALDEIYKNADIAAAQALQDMASALKAVDDTQRRLDNLKTDANQAVIDAAHANMILARAQLDKAQEDFGRWKNKPETNLKRAVFQSRLAQAQQVYDAAVRKYNGLLGSATEIELAQAQADLALAQAELANSQQNYETLRDGPDPGELALASARIVHAQAQLALAEAASPTNEQLALAQAQLDSARSNLEITQAQIDKMIITAPIDGVISALRISEGEWVVPGVVVIELLDVSRWRIETRNVGELQIGRVQTGQEVKVKVNAFQNETLSGQVVAISPVAVVQQGDTTYTLLIELEPTGLNLRPGMTARVEVLIE